LLEESSSKRPFSNEYDGKKEKKTKKTEALFSFTPLPRKYSDYNNRPQSAVSFMPAIASTSGRLHSEFVRLLFLQAHRETDRFFVGTGVHLPETNPSVQFHFHR
jgi:hypothetical protein